jgi:ribosomal protein L21E
MCAVKIDRKGQNPKELTVHRGELIEIEDSSKKWWRARNFHGEVGHVPNNIVEEIEIEHRPLVCKQKKISLNIVLLFFYYLL